MVATGIWHGCVRHSHYGVGVTYHEAEPPVLGFPMDVHSPRQPLLRALPSLHACSAEETKAPGVRRRPPQEPAADGRAPGTASTQAPTGQILAPSPVAFRHLSSARLSQDDRPGGPRGTAGGPGAGDRSAEQAVGLRP